MKIIKLTIVSILAAALWMFYTSGPPAGYTGSPADGRSCTACHASSGNFSPSVTLSHDIPETGYVPNTTYNITLEVSSEASKHGFQLTAEDADQLKQGTFQSLDNYVQILNDGTYVEHTSSGTTQTSWTFQWTAPAEGAGQITFYAAVNAANGDNTSSGDTPVTFELAVQQMDINTTFLEGIRIYPNPSPGYVFMEGLGEILPEKYYLLNSQNQIIHQGYLYSAAEKIEFPTDIKQGVYYLHIFMGEKKGVYPLIIIPH